VKIDRGFLRAVLAAVLLSQAGAGLASESNTDPGPPEDAGSVTAGKSADQIAIELASPIHPLFYMDIDAAFRTYEGTLPGSDDETAWALNFESAFPFLLDNGKTLVVRAAVPFFLDQAVWVINPRDPIWEPDTDYRDFRLRQSPYVTPDTGGYIPGYAHDHLGDITLAASYGGVSDSGFISMFGLGTVLPTSQDLSSSRDQWLLVPEVAIGKQADWGVIGVRASHLTRLSGEDRWDTNETRLDLFFAYGLGNGWQLISNPEIVYDWEADKDHEWLLPLGGGVAKTFMTGQTPWRIAA
jgi:hypothetical protein